MNGAKDEVGREIITRVREQFEEEKLVEKTTERVIEYLRENEDRNKRKNNLIMYNIPEFGRERPE